MSVSELAQILFVSPLQASAHPTPEDVRAAIERLISCGCGDCAATVAQEAGDHPETYAQRMRWALAEVVRAYPVAA